MYARMIGLVLGILAIGAFVALPAAAKNPYAVPNNTWISINGTVGSVTADSFILDYGDGTIIVEMDDGDRDGDAYKLIEGDKVTVNGMIDDDLFETRTIEASSVYVEKLNTHFFASAVDEEDAIDPVVVAPVAVPSTTIRGTVTSVSADEFVVNTGLRSIRVEVEEMPYNPLDDEGYQRIELGDVVSVTGTMDADFFEGRELVARSVTELID